MENFPVAILIGQISAALITGNKVTIKPSEYTSILGYIIIKKFMTMEFHLIH
jgi:delta 1-pyrroline-5-carboxylate dehydrogenase